MADGEGWTLRGPVPKIGEADGFFAPARWPRYGEPMRCIILGRDIVAVPIHWLKGRAVACVAPEPCQGCNPNRKRRPQYHVAAWDVERGICVVLVLGVMGCARLLDVAQARNQLRGLELVLHKLRERNRASIEIDCIGTHDPKGKLRQPFDLGPQLRRLFGVEVLPEWTMDNGGE